MRTIAAGQVPTSRPLSNLLQKVLLACGILASAWYVAMNILVPIQWPAYSVASQTVSELSAIGAPTRPLWGTLAVVYMLLSLAFALGVLKLASTKGLKIVGAALLLNAALGPFWPPMQLRGNPFATTDALHIAFSVVTVGLMLVAMYFGAASFGRRFRLYTVATVVLWLLFGTLTAIEAPGIATGEPTPLIGMWERINIGLYMMWLAVLSVKLLKSG